MQVFPLTQDEEKKLLDLSEDHFNDLKSKLIAPAKLQEVFVAFANSDGGDIYIGIEDPSKQGERINGFINQEEANAMQFLSSSYSLNGFGATERLAWQLII